MNRGIVTLLLALVPSLAAAQGTVQWTLDRDATLVSKDVGPERWAITYRLSDSRVTGNVFRSDGGPSSFLQCNRTGGDPSGLLFDCYGAAACTGSPCPTSQYTLVASNVELAQSFFFPPGETPPGSGEFTPGTYVNTERQITCSLIASPFGSRTELVLTCTAPDDDEQDAMTLVWYTGPIVGNPLEAQLLNGGFDDIPGNEQFGWGRTSTTTGTNNFAGCFSEGELISARQAQNTLNLARYFFSDASFDCGLTLVRQVP